MRSGKSITLIVVALVFAAFLLLGGFLQIVRVATDSISGGLADTIVVVLCFSSIIGAAFWLIAALFLSSPVSAGGTAWQDSKALSAGLIVSSAIYALTLLGVGIMYLLTGFSEQISLGLLNAQVVVSSLSACAGAFFWVLLALTLVKLLERVKPQAGSSDTPPPSPTM